MATRIKPVMSDIEEIVYDWLVKRNIVFSFQVSVGGGHFSLGGAVVDFMLTDLRIALRVAGEYWHRGVVPEARDKIQKEMLTGLGFVVVDIFGNDIKERLAETMRLALQGREIL